MQRDERVIVVGAGPVGAVSALALVKKGIPVTLIEAEAEPPEDQRAATIHPPTVEMLAELGLKDEVPYPFVVQWEQYKLVRAARPHIEASGIAEVRFSTKVTGLAQTADHVEATLTNAQGESEKLRGRYLIGADGGRSTVRRLADIAFEGFTWPERFIKIGTSFDFGATGQGFCTRNYFSDPDEWINLFKVKGK